MRVQVLFFAFLCFGLFAALPASRTDKGPAPALAQKCFDFSQMITSPLHERVPVGVSKSGKLSENRYWAATRGEVHQPISRILKDLLNHDSTKSGDVAKMRITPLEDSRFLSHQIVSMEVDPFPLVTVTWEEEWGFTLLKGTVGAPESLIASYEKTAGTSYIKHLCGNIELEKVSPDVTDVYLYEESEAHGRTEAKTLNGIQATLKSLGKSLGKSLEKSPGAPQAP